MGLFDKLFGSKKKKAPKRTLTTIKPGDIIDYYGDSYEVTQRYEISDGEYTWYEYRMKKTKDEVLYLTVEEDDEMLITITEQINWEVPADIPNKINYKNNVYHLDEHGHASVKAVGKSGSSKTYRLEGWDFEDSDGEKVFSIEKYGQDEYEVFVGEYIEESEIEIFPNEDSSN